MSLHTLTASPMGFIDEGWVPLQWLLASQQSQKQER